jgi:malonate transporter
VVWAEFFDTASISSLNKFAYWIALPSLLFNAIATSPAAGVVGVSAVYLSGCLHVCGLAMLAGRIWLVDTWADAAVFGLNGTYGNVIYLGTPVVLSVFGPSGLPPVVAIIALHTGVLLPLTAVIVECSSAGTGRSGMVLGKTLLGLCRNPVLIAILAGLAWRSSGLPLAHPLQVLLSTLGTTTAPLALFCLGASLPSLRDLAVVREAMLTASMKLLALPACIGVLSWLAGIGGLPWKVAVATAAMPTGANVFLLARNAAKYAEGSAATVVVTTSLSLLTSAAILASIR